MFSIRPRKKVWRERCSFSSHVICSDCCRGRGWSWLFCQEDGCSYHSDGLCPSTLSRRRGSGSTLHSDQCMRGRGMSATRHGSDVHAPSSRHDAHTSGSKLTETSWRFEDLLGLVGPLRPSVTPRRWPSFELVATAADSSSRDAASTFVASGRRPDADSAADCLFPCHTLSGRD